MYLNSFNVIDVPPGPFSVKLKYDLKNKLFKSNRLQMFFIPAIASFLILISFVSLLIIKPEIAAQINYAFTGDKPFPEFLEQKPIIYTEGNIRANEVNSIDDLKNLSEDKTYIIRKERKKGRNIFYINEQNKNPKIVY